MDNVHGIPATIENLSDLELAVLVCLIAHEHCIIRGSEDLLDDLKSELQLVALETFHLSCVAFDCSKDTTLDEFRDALVVEDAATGEEIKPLSPSQQPTTVTYHSDTEKQSLNALDNCKIANVVIAKNLDQASHDVQIQALELMRSRHIPIRRAVHTAPKQFVFLAIISFTTPGPPFLTSHLNDFFLMSHTHGGSEETLHIVTRTDSEAASLTSQSSILRPTQRQPPSYPPSRSDLNPTTTITNTTLTALQNLASTVRATAEIRRHIHNIPTFLRLHRFVAGGASARSTRHLTLLSHVTAALHGVSYVTPSFVALAARKVYAHRVELVRTPTQERSMQWGSDWRAVEKALVGVTVDGVIEEVLRMVEAPL